MAAYLGIVVLRSLLNLYVLVLLIRVVLDWVRLFSRSWRPRGIVLILANLVYAMTDPPLKLIGRFMPKLHVGGVGIDLSFIVLYFLVVVLQRLLAVLASSLL